jgi:hypothetical protein
LKKIWNAKTKCSSLNIKQKENIKQWKNFFNITVKLNRKLKASTLDQWRNVNKKAKETGHGTAGVSIVASEKLRQLVSYLEYFHEGDEKQEDIPAFHGHPSLMRVRMYIYMLNIYVWNGNIVTFRRFPNL